MYATNQLPRQHMEESTTGCCPPAHPEDWDGEMFTFDNKPFMRFESRSAMYVPVDLGDVMVMAMQQAGEAEAIDDETMLLSRDVSPWKAEHFLAVSHEVPGFEMVRLSGTYLAKVFEGPYSQTGKWYRQLLKFVRSKGQEPGAIYFSYTTCPKCAEAYGKNYVVGFAQVA